MAGHATDLSKTAIARGHWRKVQLSVLKINLLTYLQKKVADRNYTLFNQGTYVWLPDEVEQFLPAKVLVSFERGSVGQVERLDTQEIVDVSAEMSAVLARLDEESLLPMEDMVQLKELAERSILHNIRLRFNQDKIYTSVGTILVAVNPFKMIDGMYAPELLDKYSKSLSDPTSTLPPHIFEVAARSYHSLLADKADQSVVVSGESGAGKTEATKHVLRFLTSVAASGSVHAGKSSGRSSSSSGTLQDQILMANPVMEAFGNAKTVRNNNSSRFGKWIKVDLHSTTGKIIGGSITSYLLEKSRIVGQTHGERNYHIFYQLCSIRDLQQRSIWKLGDARDFAYLSGGGDGVSADVDDEAELMETYEAMESLGVEKDTVNNIMQLLSGLLHLGNLEFEERNVDSTDGSQVNNPEVLNDACEMLRLEPEDVQKCMCETVVKAGREVLPRHNTPEQARAARDTLVKYVYDHLFQWIIATINSSFEKLRVVTKANEKRFVGVLDIFGFESFTLNSLEQLCINFCNEKLQNFFNEYIFKLELKEYQREGVDVSGIKFENNEVCLELIEGRPTGVLAVLDDSVGASRNDKQFLSQIQKAHRQHLHFPKVHPRNQQTHFQVFHFAGVVEYAVEGFVEKSQNKVPSLMEDLIVSDKNEKSFVSTLFPGLKKKKSSDSAGNNGARGGGKKGKDTVGSQFKGQLDSLVTALRTTTPHFVRCIKPNDEKLSDRFTSQMVMMQLRYAGLLQVCEIRRNGYPVRKTHLEFVKRYAALGKLPNVASLNGSTAEAASKMVDLLIKQMCEEGVLYGDEWRKGREKILMRQKQYDDVEVALGLAMWSYATFVQRRMRGSMARLRFKNFKAALATIEATVDLGSLNALRESLSANCQALPHNGNSRSVQLAKIRAKIDEWEMLLTNVSNHVDACANASNNKEQSEEAFAKLQTAVDEAVDAGLRIAKNDVLKTAQKTLDQPMGLTSEQQATVDALEELIVKNINAASGSSSGVEEGEAQLTAIQSALDKCRAVDVTEDDDAFLRGLEYADTLAQWLGVQRERVEAERVAALKKEETEAKAKAETEAAAAAAAEAEEEARLAMEEEKAKLDRAQAEERQRLAAIEEQKRSELEKERNEQREIAQRLMLEHQKQKAENEQLRRQLENERDGAVGTREALVAELEEAKRNAVIQAQERAAERVGAEWEAKRDREIAELLEQMKGDKELTEQQSKIALEEATRAMEQRMDTEIRDAVIRAAAEVVVEYQMQKTKALLDEEERQTSSQQPKGVTTRESTTSVSSNPENSNNTNRSKVSALLSMHGHESSEATRLAIQAMLDERDRMEDTLRSDIRGVFDSHKQQEIEFLNTVQQHLGGDAVAAEVTESATQLIMEQQNGLNEMRLLFQKFVSSLCFSEDRFLEKVNDVSRRLDGTGEKMNRVGGDALSNGCSGASATTLPIAEKKPPHKKEGGLMGLIAMCGGSQR